MPNTGATTTKAVADDIRWQIAQQGLAAGTQLPTEPEYMQRFNVSRTTVRRALEVLQAEGLIASVHGRGRFVLGPGGQTGVRPQTKTDKVVAYARRVIADAQSGTPLPPVSQIRDALDVSQPIVQRALRMLRDEGAIIMRNRRYLVA